MATSPRRLLALVMFVAFGSTGCLQALQVVGASLELAGAIARASSSGPAKGSSACCYAREDATPVEDAVDRPMSDCELARGRWREANQAQDEVPAELRCTAEGAYPPATFPIDAPPPAPTAPAAPSMPEML